MSDTERHEGRCLCGACRVSVRGSPGDISACHCRMCTRWSGSIQMGLEVPRERVTIEGPVKRHQSSEIAERAWCDTCGSALWFTYTAGRDAGYLELSPGLFENACGARLTRVVYSDRCPSGFALAGDHERVDQADYEASNPPIWTDGSPRRSEGRVDARVVRPRTPPPRPHNARRPPPLVPRDVRKR